jgi:endonuclease/exonuclease/phosphatase (EEP) superfamily protein YafD
MPTLVTYNIRHGGVGREAALIAVIRSTRADVVVLQEAVTPAVVERLAQECELPHFQSRPGYSLAYLSRNPVVSCTWRRSFWTKRSVLRLELDGGLVVFGVHLSAIHSNVTEWRRAKEVQRRRSPARHRRGLQHPGAG